MSEKVLDFFTKLANYCKSETFKSYDPYDGMNVTLFKAIPLINKGKPEDYYRAGSVLMDKLVINHNNSNE